MSTNDQDEGRGRVRASDADRERVVDQLRRHHEAGRLDGDEFTERMEHALSARWIDELPPLLSDLPDPDQPDAAEAPGRSGGQSWAGTWRPYLPVFGPVVGVLVILAIIGSIAAVVNGHFPFPLFWLLFALFAVKPWLRRRFAAARHPQR